MRKFAEIREIVEHVIDNYNDLISRSGWLRIFRLLDEAETEIKGSLKRAVMVGMVSGTLTTLVILGIIAYGEFVMASSQVPSTLRWLMRVLGIGSVICLLVKVAWGHTLDTIMSVTKPDGGQEKGDGR